MNRFVQTLLALVLVTGTLGGAAQATTLARLTPDQLVDAADLIVEGTILSVRTERDAQERVFTFAEVQVATSLKGEAPSVLTVQSAGGILPSGEPINVDGAARYSAGERVLLYLSSVRHGTAYGTVGMMFGKYTIRQNPTDGSDMVVRFAVPYTRAYDARFIPNPPASERVSLVAMEQQISGRLALGWDGKAIAGVSSDHLRAINKLQVGVQ